MKIYATVKNSYKKHDIFLQTDNYRHSITISPKSSGFGSSANGGELLFLALATCYCNDIYREAAKKGIDVTGVEVSVKGSFGAEGEPASDINYNVKVSAKADENSIKELMLQTDKLTEIQNTIRKATHVKLISAEAIMI